MIKINYNGVNIAIVYNMKAYILKVIHADYGTLNFFPVIQYYNTYHRVDNNFGGDSGTVILDYRYLFVTFIP